MLGKIISAVIVLIVVIWLYVAVSYMAHKKDSGESICGGDCSHCGGCVDKGEKKKDEGNIS